MESVDRRGSVEDDSNYGVLKSLEFVDFVSR